MQKNIACIILAAGKGVRMKSALPKVMHPLCGRPMLGFVLDLAGQLKFKQTVCVLGHKHQEVKGIIPSWIRVVVQRKIAGTADAVRTALTALPSFHGSVLILYGDIPLLKKETIQKLLEYHSKNNPDATVLTATPDKPSGYGRVIRDKYAAICRIVEEKDADDFQKSIKEINTGIVVFQKDKLASALRKVRPNNRKKEYYLTDIIEILYKNDGLIEGIKIDDFQETLGINSRQDLSQANRLMQRRIHQELMKSGVTLVDPESTFIHYGAKIGQDTVIYPFTVIENDVRIGKRCKVGPFAHLRAGTRLKDFVEVGNFVETARTSLGSKTLAKHFCYLGDCVVGDQVNIGAGSVSANFDGAKKNKTVIKDKAFIGSDTVLVAPVKIGRAAKTGAGSVVLKNSHVPDGSVVVGLPARLLKKKN